MKPSAFLFVLLMAVGAARVQAQPVPSCCAPQAQSSNEAFAALGSDPQFVMAHLAPLPFQKDQGPGKMITFKTKDGKKGRAYEVRAPKASNKVLLVFHEYWGLNDYIKQEAERLQKELGDVTVIAPDLYDGKVSSDPNEAAKLMQGVKEERARAIISGAIAHAGKKAQIGTIGWCFGGGWSLQSALMAGRQTEACVIFYGMPEKDPEKLKALHSDVLGIFAKQDKWITPVVVEDFEKAMKAAGKELEVKSYDADHAFANPSNPHFNSDAAQDAHAVAIEYLKKHFESLKG